MSKIEKLLKHLGINKTLEEIESDEFNEIDAVDSVINEKIQLHIQKNPSSASEEQIKAARIAGSKEIKKTVGRLFKLDKTGAELENMDGKEFAELISGAYTELSEKSTTDEKLKKQLDDIRQKYLNATEELEDTKGLMQNKILEAQKMANDQIRNFRIDKHYDEIFSSLELGIPKESVPIFVDGIKTKISAMPWTINEDGTLSGPDGTGLAIDFEGKGSFKTLKDAVNYLTAPAIKKSSPPPPPGQFTPVTGDQKTDEAAQAAVKRLEERLGVN